jgi:hypothetical protein
MQLHQQLVDEQVELIQTTLAIDADAAFLRFVHCLITGESLHSLDPEDIVDAGGDKQIDAVTIQEVGNEADIWITKPRISRRSRRTR